MDNPCNNFHKIDLDKNFQKFCLGDEKLQLILNEMLNHSDISLKTKLLLPFGGPGSATNFFDYYGYMTIAGDIEYWKKYGDPYKQLEKFRIKHSYEVLVKNFYNGMQRAYLSKIILCLWL